MRRQPAIVRCFGALCCMCAVTLVALEWRNPFPDPVVTPEGSVSIAGGRDGSAQASARGASAQAADWPTEVTADGSKRKFWQRSQPQKDDTPAALSVRLVLSLEERHLEVVREGKPTIRFDVAVGQDDWQTPTGEFTVMSKLENPAWMHPITKEEIPPGPENPLGARWIGFWTDGRAQIGFHGTNQEELIGEAVSHGCVRMRNRDVKMLYELVEVGTIVEVSAKAVPISAEEASAEGSGAEGGGAEEGNAKKDSSEVEELEVKAPATQEMDDESVVDQES